MPKKEIRLLMCEIKFNLLVVDSTQTVNTQNFLQNCSFDMLSRPGRGSVVLSKVWGLLAADV